MTYDQILGAVICGSRHARKTLTPPEKRALLQQLKSMDCLAGHAEYREETIAVDAPMAPGTDSLQ